MFFIDFISKSIKNVSCAFPQWSCAQVAELVDAQDLKSCLRKEVRVRFPPWAPLVV